MIAHIKANASTTVACDRRVRRGAWRTARPPRPRLVSWTLTSRCDPLIYLMRRLTMKPRMRAMLTMPVGEERKLPAE
jgi:hypothetical protein